MVPNHPTGGTANKSEGRQLHDVSSDFANLQTAVSVNPGSIRESRLHNRASQSLSRHQDHHGAGGTPAAVHDATICRSHARAEVQCGGARGVMLSSSTNFDLGTGVVARRAKPITQEGLAGCARPSAPPRTCAQGYTFCEHIIAASESAARQDQKGGSSAWIV
jgi:hypothetical protein